MSDPLVNGKKLSTLRVVDLKAELTARDLSTIGLKAALAKRLLEAIEAEGPQEVENGEAAAEEDTAGEEESDEKEETAVEESEKTEDEVVKPEETRVEAEETVADEVVGEDKAEEIGKGADITEKVTTSNDESSEEVEAAAEQETVKTDVIPEVTEEDNTISEEDNTISEEEQADKTNDVSVVEDKAEIITEKMSGTNLVSQIIEEEIKEAKEEAASETEADQLANEEPSKPKHARIQFFTETQKADEANKEVPESAPEQKVPSPTETKEEKASEDTEPEASEEEKEALSEAGSETALNVLIIRNLMRPYSNPQLKSLIAESGSLKEGNEYFFLDRLKSTCVCTFVNEEDAQKAKAALDGIVWPDKSAKKLSVEFGTLGLIPKFRKLDAEGKPLFKEPFKRSRSTSRLASKEKTPEHESSPETKRAKLSDRTVEAYSSGVQKITIRNEASQAVAEEVATRRSETPEGEVKKIEVLFNRTETKPALFWKAVDDKAFHERMETVAYRRKLVSNRRSRSRSRGSSYDD